MKKVAMLILLFLLLDANFSYGQSSPGRWRMVFPMEAFEIQQNPQNINTLYAGGRGRTIYKSYDGGMTWDTIVIGYRGGPAVINNIITHPTDTSMIIVGGITFGDIRLSTDQGKSWKIVLADDINGIPITCNGKAIAVDPHNPDLMYLGDNMTGIIYKSTDKGHKWDSISWVKKPETGQDKGTDLPRLDSNHRFVRLGSLVVRRDSNNIIFANGTDGRVYMSSNYGKNWKWQTTLLYPDSAQSDCEITRMVFSNRDPLIAYCVITYAFMMNKPNGGIFKTTDGGYSWKCMGLRDTSMWAVEVRNNPKGDDDEIFVGGFSDNYYKYAIDRVPGATIVMRSQDGGKSWFSYDNHIDWYNEDTNFIPRGNVWMQRYMGQPGNQKLYMATEAGLYVLDDPSPVIDIPSCQTDNFFNAYQISNGQLFFKYQKCSPAINSDLELTLYDMLGNALIRKVYSNYDLEFLNESIGLPHLAQGYYICQMKERGKIATKMIMISW